VNDQEKPDPIDAAIAATANSVTLMEIPVTIASTGRPFKITVPVDMTDGELAEVMGWMGSGLLNHFRAERAKTAGGRIIVPRGSLPS
jgi:hypothetical protein